MRALIGFVACLTFGLFSIVIPPTIFWLRWTYERTGDRNLAWGLVIGVTIGVVVGLTSAFSVRGFGSFAWMRGAAIAFATALAVGISATALAYSAIAMFPEPLMQGPQGPFWIFHPGTYVGLLCSSLAAVTMGQLAGPEKDFRTAPR